MKHGLGEPDESMIAHRPWELQEHAILTKVSRRATLLMLLGYAVYVAGCTGALLLFGATQTAGLVIMVIQFLMIIWMGTKAMYQNMSSMFQLQLAASRETMPTFERLATALEKAQSGDHPIVEKVEVAIKEASEDLKAIREAIERSTKPMPVTRRDAPATRVGA